MIDTIFFFAYHSLTLVFGIVLSAAFCAVKATGKNCFILSSLLIFCGILQISVLSFLGEALVWKLYPLITHLPLLITLRLIFKKSTSCAIAAITTAYLCCQPSKWVGLLSEALIENVTVVWCIRLLVMTLVATITIYFVSSYISEIFNKDTRSVLIFSSIPIVYYAFDYVVGVYTNLWAKYYRITAEFLAFFLCVAFLTFCIVYYKEYEKKADAERKEHILSITSLQHAKEIANIKQSIMETRLLRHDMRLLLNNLALSIENDDKDTALQMISGYVANVEAASLHRYCKNDTVNYVITNFEAKCKEQETQFCIKVEFDELDVDEIMFSSIISNALDNALNAQAELDVKDRRIKLMIKKSEKRLLVCIENPYKTQPVFSDGIPITNKKGHGYGVQSIRHTTEKLGGKCRFGTDGNIFILQIIL